MRYIVKNTTKCGLLELLCPHRCRGCGEIGGILCECCKKDMTADVLNHCPKCGYAVEDYCRQCKMPFTMTFVVGYRDELIGVLAEEYKFFGVRSLKNVIVEVIDDFVPDLGGDVSIVPLPTIRKHVRERGVDHTYEVAKGLARRRGWKVERLLVRKNDTIQIGSGVEARKKQAARAFELNGKIDKNRTYVIYDDIWTTGATMMVAGRLLRRNGAKKIVALLLATVQVGKKPDISR